MLKKEWEEWGISYNAIRFSKANNKYIQSYDDKKSSKFIMCLDPNNLHVWEMSQYLPQRGFKWLNQRGMHKLLLNLIEYNAIEENSSDG